jgi:hypothetical protein
MANTVPTTGDNMYGWPGVGQSNTPLLQEMLWNAIKGSLSEMGKPPQGGAYTLPGPPTPPVAPVAPVAPTPIAPPVIKQQVRTPAQKTAAAALAAPGGVPSTPDKLPPATEVPKPAPAPEIPYGGLPGELPPEPDVAGRITKAYEQAYPENLEDVLPRQSRPAGGMGDWLTNMSMAAAGQDPVAYRRQQQSEDEAKWTQAVNYKLQRSKGQYDLEMKKADMDMQKYERTKQDALALLTQQYNADPERAMKSEKWVSDFSRIHMPGATPEQIKDYVNTRKDPKTGQLVGPRNASEKWADDTFGKYVAMKSMFPDMDDGSVKALAAGIQGYNAMEQEYQKRRKELMKQTDSASKKKKLDQLDEDYSDYVEATKGLRNKDLLAMQKLAAQSQASFYRAQKDLADAQLKQWKAPPVSAQILALADPSIKDPTMGAMTAQTYMKGAQTAIPKVYKATVGKLNLNKEIFTPTEHESLYTMGKGSRMWLIQGMMTAAIPPAEKQKLWKQLGWPANDFEYYKLSQKDKNLYLAESQYAYQLLQEADAKPDEVIRGIINYGQVLRGGAPLPTK